MLNGPACNCTCTTPLRQLRVTHRASPCAECGGHMQSCLKPRRACGIKPAAFEFRVRGRLLSPPPTAPITGPGGRWCPSRQGCHGRRRSATCLSLSTIRNCTVRLLCKHSHASAKGPQLALAPVAVCTDAWAPHGRVCASACKCKCKCKQLWSRPKL